jgi:hypothetical protein
VTDPIIEHNPHEKRPTNGIWWAAWGVVALMWVAQTYLGGFDWGQIALGAFTAFVFSAWVLELTGNELPSFMSSKRRDR